jgi:hypothetical protein
MSFLIPSKSQWNRWSLPSKLTLVGVYMGIIGIAVTIVFFFWPTKPASPVTVIGSNNAAPVIGIANSPGANVNVGFPPTQKPTNPPIEEQINYYSKMAQARQWLPPELPQNLPDFGGTKLISVKFGGLTEDWPVGSEDRETSGNTAHPILFPGGRPVTAYIKDNRLYVKAQTPIGESETTVMMNNEWPIKIPDGWDRNFNATEFEIVDDKMLPVFQLRYDAAYAIEIYGIFVAPNGAVTIAFGDETSGSPPGRPIPNIPERKAWFKYPSKDNLGVLAN